MSVHAPAFVCLAEDNLREWVPEFSVDSEPCVELKMTESYMNMQSFSKLTLLTRRHTRHPALKVLSGILNTR